MTSAQLLLRYQALKAAQEELDAARREAAENEPALRTELDEWRGELAEVEAEKSAVWEQVPARDQAVFQRVRVRPSIAEVKNNQCTACRVTVTSRGLQMLRQGDEIVNCENCGRILVLA